MVALISTLFVLGTIATANAFVANGPSKSFLSSRSQASSTSHLNIFSKPFFANIALNGSKSKDDVVTDDEVRGLFTLWNDSLATGNPKIVASRYASDAVLLPTVSDVPRTDAASITDYFTTFLQRKPRGEILEGFIKKGDGWCQDSGIYEFNMGDDQSKVKARYTFFYVKEGGKWKIQHHHSSVMPEKMTFGQDITEEQVKNLFHLWNDALATNDSGAVADRYAKEAVLLPTVSDQPRNTRAQIVDYFDNFLKLEPQGVILESNVMMGANWCQDAGIYEFTLGASGDKVKARYSFVYVFEEGSWKIAHHHSSKMPEGQQDASASSGEPVQKLSKEKVRDLFDLWNNALATGDPKKVAARYAKEAVLLPTVSDVPRTTKPAIIDYFTNFLKMKPQGVITDGNVLVGENWCEDAGVYEFTMGKDGSQVVARYSFVYVYEDGEWKIAHHHSSAMPEDMIKAANKVKELERVFAM